MDTRIAMLKSLRKEAKYERRKYFSVWKGLAVVMLLVVLLTALTGVATELQEQESVSRINRQLQDWITQAGEALDLPIDFSSVKSVLGHERFVPICQIVAGAALALLVLFAALWGRGKRKWKRSGAYLDYQTMYVTLKAERQAARGK